MAPRSTSAPIGGGTARNVIAGQAHCLVDVRITDQSEADRVDRVLAGVQPTDARVTVTVGGGWNRPPLRPTPASMDLFDLADEIATELRGPLQPISVGGGSDANFVAALGVPVLDGLGSSGAGAHARHEHILIDHVTGPARAPRRAASAARLPRTRLNQARRMHGDACEGRATKVARPSSSPARQPGSNRLAESLGGQSSLTGTRSFWLAARN